MILLAGCPATTPPAASWDYVVLAWNDLGMHCMNEDFSELMILPPYNTLHAQVIDRRHGEPEIVRSGVQVSYMFPDNTSSVDKTNFWEYAQALFGVALAPNVGLTGRGLSGNMTPTGNNDWSAEGIPLTPLNDRGEEDAYPLALVKVIAGGKAVASTLAVAPVSWEISCQLCHNTPGVSAATDILRAHDRLHGTTLEQEKPVMCSECHAQAPLGTTGSPSLSSAIHSSHATRMHEAQLANACYACHPGIRTQCLRDVHYIAGKDCQFCHGDMAAVGNPARRPWVDEPRCDDCHDRAGFEFEQADTLYRNSKGHRGIHCAACHGSPHAITPTAVQQDNIQALMVQGHRGTIDTCAVCHAEPEDDPFPHRVVEEDDDKATLFPVKLETLLR
jgi:hypothetical protein